MAFFTASYKSRLGLGVSAASAPCGSAGPSSLTSLLDSSPEDAAARRSVPPSKKRKAQVAEEEEELEPPAQPVAKKAKAEKHDASVDVAKSAEKQKKAKAE